MLPWVEQEVFPRVSHSVGIQNVSIDLDMITEVSCPGVMRISTSLGFRRSLPYGTVLKSTVPC